MSKKVRIPKDRMVETVRGDACVAPTDWPLIVFFSALAICFATAFIFSTMVPYFQMTTYLENIRTGRIQKIIKTDSIFTPYTYAQRVIRYEFLKYIEEQKLNAGNISLLDNAVEKMQESVAIEGSSPYQYIRLGRAMERKVEVLHDTQYFKLAEGYYKKAISLSPKRQEASYAYGLSLIRQGKPKASEAVAVLTGALDKTIPISYYYLGLAEFNFGKETYPKSLEHMEWFFETNTGNPDQNASRNIYERLLYHYYGAQDKTSVRIASARLASFHTDLEASYQKVIALIDKNNRLPTLQFNGDKLYSVGDKE